MLAAQRQQAIVEEVARTGGARVADLARRLHVTQETIRRDLDALAAAGRLLRRHGGALPAEDGGREPPHAERARSQPREKNAIAREAARRVRPGETILLDASSTALFLARHLPDRELTVLTNSLLVAEALAGKAKVRVTLVGGTLFRPSRSCLGPAAEQALGSYHADKLFLSARAVDAARGLRDANEQQAALKRLMIDAADQRFVLADHSKFGLQAPDFIAGIRSFHELITDSRTGARELDRWRRAGCRVTRVKAGAA